MLDLRDGCGEIGDLDVDVDTGVTILPVVYLLDGYRDIGSCRPCEVGEWWVNFGYGDPEHPAPEIDAYCGVAGIDDHVGQIADFIHIASLEAIGSVRSYGPAVAAGLAYGFCGCTGLGLGVRDGGDDENQSDRADGQQDPQRPTQAPTMLCRGLGDGLYEDIVATALGAAYLSFVRAVGRIGLLGHGDRIADLCHGSSSRSLFGDGVHAYTLVRILADAYSRNHGRLVDGHSLR